MEASGPVLLMNGVRSCRLDHGDILVMEGQCQDEFLHCTSPGLEHERINVTYRWIRQHTHFCPLFKAGMVCCLPTCTKGSSVHVTGNLGVWLFLGFLVSSLCFVHAGGIGFVFLPPGVYKTWVLLVCFFFWSRPLGVDRLWHYLHDHWEESMAVHNTTVFFGGWVVFFLGSFLWVGSHIC